MKTAAKKTLRYNWQVLTEAGLNFLLVYGILGLTTPFTSPLFAFLSYSKSQIGLIMGATGIATAIMPLLSGLLADRGLTIKSQMQFFLLSILGLSTLLIPKFIHLQPAILVGVIFLIFCAGATFISLYNTMAMNVANQIDTREYTKIYSIIRSLGSLGFMLVATFSGLWLGETHTDRYFLALPLLAALAYLATFFLPQVTNQLAATPPAAPKKGVKAAKALPSFWSQLTPFFWLWLTAMLLNYLCMGPYFYGFTLFIKEVKIAGSYSGIIWSLALLAEAVGFYFYPYVYRYFHNDTYLVILVALIISFARWALLWLFPTPAMIIISQLCQAGFALFWTGGMQALNAFNQNLSDNHYLASYQGLFTTAVSGLASFIGMTIGGILHDHMPFGRVLLCMLPLQLIAILIMWYCRNHQPEYAVLKT